MKLITQLTQKLAVLLCLISSFAFTQENEVYISVMTMYWNMDKEDFSMIDWRTVESEFHEKVTMKNEYVLSTTTLVHHFTNRSDEVLYVKVYPNWQAINDATKREEELIVQAWPNKTERDVFLSQRSSFYAKEHSDEIYYSIPGSKALEDIHSPSIYYVRTSHMAFPEDGTNEEFNNLLDQYNQEVTFQNEFYKGYYSMKHHSGSDRSEFIEVFVAETLANLEKGIAKQGELFRLHWDTQEKSDDFNNKFDKYYTGVHSDRIYSSVPELYKQMSVEEN